MLILVGRCSKIYPDTTAGGKRGAGANGQN
jgi:hypothetical protein